MKWWLTILAHMLLLHSVFHFLSSMHNTGRCNWLLASLMSYSPRWGTDLWHFFFFDLITCSAFAFLIYWANTLSVWLHRQEGFVSNVDCLLGERKFDFHVVLLRYWYLAGVCVCVCECAAEYQAHRSGGSSLITREWGEIIKNKEMKSSVCCYSVLFHFSYLKPKTISSIKTHICLFFYHCVGFSLTSIVLSWANDIFCTLPCKNNNNNNNIIIWFSLKGKLKSHSQRWKFYN